MAYFNNLFSHTTETTPASPYAPPPSVVCDFGWYSTTSSTIFGTLIYDVAGNTYPPTNDNSIPPIVEATVPWFVDYVCETGVSVTFDCYDQQTLGLPTLIIPSGISIVEYAWDLGNGQVGQGPLVTTIYEQASPDASCTLTVTDSLNRRVTTTKRLNFNNVVQIFGESGHSVS
jgi:hypothetical protein